MLGNNNQLPSGIIFSRKISKPSFSFNFNMNKQLMIIESNAQKLFLLNKFCAFPIFDVIPKTFTITTKHGKSMFNIDMISNASPVISELISNNPNTNQYDLNINDEENVLGKFEDLFLGKTIFFDEDDIPTSQRITKILKIKNCPNYLKPDSLKSDEIDLDGKHHFQSSNKSSVVINLIAFVNYLNKESNRKITIKTNKNEYKCNKFGILASNVFRQTIEKDPTINELVFNFEDEFDEFQQICNLFNFCQVDITNDNMYFLKEIADELKIDCVIKQLDDYINQHQQITQKIDEQQTIIDSIDDLFNLLYNVKIIGIEKVKDSIVRSKWSQSEESVQELAAFILQVISPNFFLHKEMSDLLIQLNHESNETNKLNNLMPFIINKLMLFFPMPKKPTKNYGISKGSFNFGGNNSLSFLETQNKRYVFLFIRILYKKGLIPKEEIISQLKVIDNYYDIKLVSFFLPELIELNPNCISFLQSNKFSMFIKKYLSNKNIDSYEQMLDKMEPDDTLTKSFRNDDVDTLQSIITQNEIDISKEIVPYNIFDDFDDNPTFLNYAALYGSIKCFKYLLLNNGKIDQSSLYFAVYGGNTEIIKIVDQRSNEIVTNTQNTKKKFSSDLRQELFITKIEKGHPSRCIDHTNDKNIISSTIQMHRNDLFDWLFENKFLNKGKNGDDLKVIAEMSAINGNAHALIEIINAGYANYINMIPIASKHGYYKLTHLLLNILDQKGQIKDKKYLSEFNNSAFSASSVIFGSLSIFKLNMKQMDQNNIEKAIILAIEKDYSSIVHYYFENITDKQSINQSFVISALNSSLDKKNDELFVYLIERINNINQNLVSISIYPELLNNACLYSNLSAVKTITDKIIDHNPEYNFSIAFIKAASSSAMNICQYFIDKKVSINYEQLSLEVYELGSVDEKLFSLIFNNVNESTKAKLLNCIEQAIIKKNKKLVEFLLKMKEPDDFALFQAVSTGDIEMVDLILKYNSEPSFINRKTDMGTALQSAIYKNYIDIVKRLLSVPGIDPSLKNFKNENALSTAVLNLSLEIVDEIINFYGDKIHSKPLIVYNALYNLSLNYDEKIRNHKSIDSDDKIDSVYMSIFKIVERLFRIESVDPNLCLKSTFFYKACESNTIEAVENLIKIDNLDVNICENKKFYTPLMIAIQNGFIKIAEILINHPKTDINLRNIKNESALMIAIKYNQEKIINLLIQNEKFEPKESRLNYAFCYSSANIAKLLLNNDSLDINQSFSFLLKKNPSNNNNNNNTFVSNIYNAVMTPLIFAVRMNDTEKIEIIINHPTFDKDKSNITEAIFCAVKTNNINVYKQLMKLNDNNIKTRNQNNESLLFTASRSLSGEIIDDLFNDPQFDSQNNQLQLSFVASFCCTTKNKKKESNQIYHHSHQQHITNITPINQHLIPAKSSRSEIMEKIIDYDNEHDRLIKFDQLLPNGKSYFTIIDENYNEIENVSDRLLEYGVDPNMPDKLQVYPLENAIKLNSLGFVSSLINSTKVDLNQFENKSKMTYLHLAASQPNNQNIIKMFINANLFDINVTNENGDTPLILACKHKILPNIEAFFSFENLDYLHKNNDGIDALRYIKNVPQDEYEEAIKSKEAYLQKIKLIISFSSNIF